MKKILLIAAMGLAAASLRAQQIYLRAPGTPFCTITGATDATPIRVTVSGACGLSEGATVVVVDVRGNYAANVHLNDASNAANLARRTVNFSSTGLAFDLVDLDGQPVPGSAPYTGGGRIGLATAYALRPHPVLFLDGPSGSRTQALTDPLQKNNTANPSRQVMINLANNYASAYNGRFGYEYALQGKGAGTISNALRWKLDGNPAALEAALFSLRNPDVTIGTPACDYTISECGSAVSSLMDYPLQYSMSYYMTYSLLRDQLTAPERNRFLEFMLSDLPWTQAGIGYTSTNLIKPEWKIRDTPGSGTIAVPQGSTTVTGNGTSFTSQLQVGDVMVIPFGHPYGIPYLVESIQSDTELTINHPNIIPASAVPWAAGPRWDSTMYGFMWHQKNQIFTPLNGAGVPEVLIGGPFYGLYAGFFMTPESNLSITRAQGMYALGLVTCADDLRGCLLASMAYEWIHDVNFPTTLMMWTGFSQGGNTYHQQRVTGPLLLMSLWSTNSLESGPDLLAGTNIVDRMAKWFNYSQIPELTLLMPNAEPALISASPDQMTSGLALMSMDKNSTPARNFKWFLENQFPYNAASLNLGGGFSAWEHYLMYDPTAVAAPAPPPTTYHFKDNNAAACVAWFGAARCTHPDVRRISVSRTGWSNTDTFLGVNAVGYACRDHCGDDTGGYYMMFRNGKALLGADSLELGMGERPYRGYPEVGGTATNMIAVPTELPLTWLSGDNTFMYNRLDMTPLYKSSANVTSVERQIFHLKQGPQDYVVDHVRGTFSAPALFKGLQHYHLNGCGDVTSTPCVALNRAGMTASNIQSNARVNTRVFGVGGDVIVDTENHSDTDGSYPGGRGRTFRFHVCAGTNGTGCANTAASEWIVVQQPSTDPLAAMPAINRTQSGIFRIVEIQDAAAPKLLAFTTSGATATSLSFTTAHAGSGQYLVTGLAAGTYRVLRGGTPISDPLPVTAGEHSLSFSSTSGAFTIDPGPPPLTILTASLPNAVLGKTYSAEVVGFSSTMPYSWDITGGSLCAGLTLTPGSPAATIAGVAQTLGETCTFTVRVRNVSNTESYSREYSFAVLPPGPGSLSITTSVLTTGRQAESYSAALLATGGTSPYRWSVSGGTVCTGLSLAEATGVLSGAPSAIGSCTFTVRVTDLGNEFAERAFTLTVIADLQTPLYISAAEASHTAAVVRFGRRGLAFDRACTLDFRLGGPAGPVMRSLVSALGPSRRQSVAEGLAPGQIYHLTATCGAETSTAQIETGLPPGEVRPVVLRLARPTLNGTPVDAVIAFGAVEAMPNSLVAPCTASECTAIVDTADPLLYWRASYRDATGAILASTAIQVRAPR
jgi:hypothetical protein